MRAAALFALGLALPLAVAPTAAQAGDATAAGPDCTLNVWGGGRPNFRPRYSARVAAVIQRSNTPEMLDPGNPLSNVNLFNTVNRARALSDEALKSLMPDARSVTIVRHDMMVDFDATPLDAIRSPIAGPATGCNADLVVANAYGIFPNLGQPYSLSLVGFAVGSALAGGDRMVIDFWYQRYAGGTRTIVVRKKDDRPLPHVRFATPELAEGMTISANANLAAFANLVVAKSPK